MKCSSFASCVNTMFLFVRLARYETSLYSGNRLIVCHGAKNYQASKFLPRPLKYHGKSGPWDSWRSSNRFHNQTVIRYVRGLQWMPIPLGVGFAYLVYQRFHHIVKRERICLNDGTEVCLASNLEIFLYKMLPLRIFSRWWGWLNSFNLPVWLRNPVLSLFISVFHCDITEAEEQNLKNYCNLSEFFCRPLKPGIRPIYPEFEVVSPVDGTVLHFGKIVEGRVEQVKGITYSLQGFLESNNSISLERNKVVSYGSDYQQSLLTGDNDLYHCVMYLAPGDYHRFHSPVTWTVQHRLHFPGELLSVRPGIATWIAGLFSLNERAVYTGKWKYGFFAMAAVGATNVGSIQVYFDKELSTNCRRWKQPSKLDCNFCENNNSGITLEKGDPFGQFNLGSTIVLIFEAPKQLEFEIVPGQKIKYGEKICLLSS